MSKREYLKIDKPIPGQYYALVSFVEPKNSNLLRELECFYSCSFMQWFLEQHQQSKQWKENNPDNKLTDEMKCYSDLSYENIHKTYSEWIKIKETELRERFNNESNQNNEVVVRGFKIRGVYATEQEARDQCEDLHNHEPAVNIFITTVGRWVPYIEECYNVSDVDYGSDKLNELLADKTLSMKAQKLAFQKRCDEKIATLYESKEDKKEDE